MVAVTEGKISRRSTSIIFLMDLAELPNLSKGWEGHTLPGHLVGDVSAAFLSATLISPILTVIDRLGPLLHYYELILTTPRAVVENVATNGRPLTAALKENGMCAFRYPRRFFFAKPFFYMWTLYSVTYTAANSVNSLTGTFMTNSHEVLANSITFLATCIVNVPLGVWKDIRFVQAFGHSSPPIAKTPSSHVPESSKKFPKCVAATFLARDAITILGSFTLPPLVSQRLPIVDPALQMAAAQLLVPVLSQIVATPVHLLGLDLYSNSNQGEKGERAKRIRRGLSGTTAVRCARIVPAFGVGGIVNTGLREWFHGITGGHGSIKEIK